MLNTMLVVPLEEARKKLESRIALGEELLNKSITTQEDLDRIIYERDNWHEYNLELLRRIFDAGGLAAGYSRADDRDWFGATLPDQIMEFGVRTSNYVQFLQSLINRLDLYTMNNVVDSRAIIPKNREVFVVHGHDHGIKEEVARVLEKLELQPIILHELANKGRTIIEKFEDHSSVAFAVVILSPDDMGYLKDTNSTQKPRARQNVIFELGYFYGKLGRDRVCVLLTGEMEQPSDIDGVTYIPVNEGEWKLNLSKELRAAGIEVNQSKL